MKNITLYTLGILLYINYRIIYAFLWHKPIMTFNEYSMSKQADATVPVIVTADLTILFIYLLGIWWTLAIWVILFVLNYAIYGGYLVYKRYF